MRATFALLTIALLAACAGAQQDRDEALFRRLDKDEDGILLRNDFPEQYRDQFDRADTDGNQQVDLAEFLAMRQAVAQRQTQRERPPLPAPTHADLVYGEHERQRIDLWLAEGEQPAPLVIYFHGGGFRSGDKRSLGLPMLQGLLNAGVHVAAANYRLTDVGPYPMQMHDAARALQFLRYHSDEYGIDKIRVAATGGSAGAGISQWLAFHDDLAEPDAEDPIARESTRLSCAVATAAQSTYDPRVLFELFGTDQLHEALFAFYGLAGPEDVQDPKFFPLFEDASPITHATADDPPVMLFYPQANTDLGPNPAGGAYIHHPKLGFHLKDKLDALGVPCVVKLREDYERGQSPTTDQLAFFFEHLGVTPPGE